MEDEAADIELLEQHLIKTSNISQRMTSILTNFDSRLIRLEKSILPLHKSTQSLTKLAESAWNKFPSESSNIFSV
jgi:exocyst complex component 7